MSARVPLAMLLLAVVAAGAVAVAALQDRAPGAGGAFDVEVIGPQGALFAGPVRVDAATALLALQATGLELETRTYPGMGTYVVSVAGHEASGPSGWVYEVLRGGAWSSGDRSAERYALEPGDALRWSWTRG